MKTVIRLYARLRWYTGAREPKRRTTAAWRRRRDMSDARLQQAITAAQAYRAPAGALAWAASHDSHRALVRGALARVTRSGGGPSGRANG